MLNKKKEKFSFEMIANLIKEFDFKNNIKPDVDMILCFDIEKDALVLISNNDFNTWTQIFRMNIFHSTEIVNAIVNNKFETVRKLVLILFLEKQNDFLQTFNYLLVAADPNSDYVLPIDVHDRKLYKNKYMHLVSFFIEDQYPITFIDKLLPFVFYAHEYQTIYSLYKKDVDIIKFLIPKNDSGSLILSINNRTLDTLIKYMLSRSNSFTEAELMTVLFRYSRAFQHRHELYPEIVKEDISLDASKKRQDEAIAIFNKDFSENEINQIRKIISAYKKHEKNNSHSLTIKGNDLLTQLS